MSFQSQSLELPALADIYQHVKSDVAVTEGVMRIHQRMWISHV